MWCISGQGLCLDFRSLRQNVKENNKGREESVRSNENSDM